MRYRIKCTLFRNGRAEYQAQVKKRIGWWNLNFKGEAVLYGMIEPTREKALKYIDKHFEGNTDEYSVEFEYINK